MWPYVTFYSGAIYAETQIAKIVPEARSGRVFVVMRESCFHPRDFRWPDQPADRGFINIRDGLGSKTHIKVLDVGKLLVLPNQESLFDSEITFKKRDMPEGSRLLCALVFSLEFLPVLQAAFQNKDLVNLHVDRDYRLAISTGHSLGHIASYVLNEVMSIFWRKKVPLDDRGYSDFIRLSQIDSKVFENGTRDVYRVGKSFRKLGFNTADAVNKLPELNVQAKSLLIHWLELDPRAEIICDGSALDDSRRWNCQLGKQSFSMFCGGTHISSFSDLDLSQLDLQLNYDDFNQSIEMIVKA